MTTDAFHDKLRGQRMVVTKTIDPAKVDLIGAAEAARRVKAALTWARAQGISAEAFLEHRELPREVRALLDDVEVEPDAEPEAEADGDTGFVYAFGFAGYPDRLKIGRTQGSVEARVQRQASGSAAPDHPAIVLTHPTPDPDALERTLHAMLHLHGRWIPTPGGREWFRITVEELHRLIELAETALDPQPPR